MSRAEQGSQQTLPMAAGRVMTVTGPIEPDVMGVTLSHEHVMSTFGAPSARYPTYDVDKLFASVLPYLERVKALSCNTIVDGTAAFFGRHPEILRHFSQESGLHILTNTGYYGAANDRYVPPHVLHENADEIAARWVREWLYSIDDTGIRPGFIKTAVDEGPLSAIDRKLIVAAARTHLRTGLTIQTHTGNNREAVQEMLSILRQERVHPSAWIWVHAHHVQEIELLTSVAKQGAWISLDGINEKTSAHIVALVTEMNQRGFLESLLLSHDGDSYFGDGQFRPYHFVFTDFLPVLKERGLSAADIDQLTVVNPQRAFMVQARTLE